MLIPYSATQSYSALLDKLSEDALSDLDQTMAAVTEEPPPVQQEALMEFVPVLGDQYVGASSLVSAQFFDELLDLNGLPRRREPETMESVGAKRWHSLVGWGMSMFERGGLALVYSLLAGGLTKTLTESAADTMVGNAAIQGGLRAQRVPRPGCCAFCGMLASRGAAYTSVESAGKVVGRGMPVGSHRKAKGVHPRGAREIGEDFHDFCRCRVVVVTEDNEVEMQATAERYFDSYRAAYDKVSDGLELNVVESMTPNGDRHNEYEWVDAGGNILTPKQRQNSIVTAMRHDLGVK